MFIAAVFIVTETEINKQLVTGSVKQIIYIMGNRTCTGKSTILSRGKKDINFYV